jgi:hypothetical protein
MQIVSKFRCHSFSLFSLSFLSLLLTFVSTMGCGPPKLIFVANTNDGVTQIDQIHFIVRRKCIFSLNFSSNVNEISVMLLLIQIFTQEFGNISNGYIRTG